MPIDTEIPATSCDVIALASQSSRRLELLAQVGIKALVVRVEVPEVRGACETPEQYVARLAQDKSQAGIKTLGPDSSLVCLGADTIVVVDGEVLEKPTSEEDGLNMLARLSGKAHTVLTGVCVSSNERSVAAMSRTLVEFGEISPARAQTYWDSDEPSDKAGGYGIQGLGAKFVKRIEGSYTGVVGLPLFETCELLQSIGVNVDTPSQ